MPSNAAPSTMAGKGNCSTVIDNSAASAMPISQPFFRERLPSRQAAASTMATTAGLMPYSTPATSGSAP